MYTVQAFVGDSIAFAAPQCVTEQPSPTAAAMLSQGKDGEGPHPKGDSHAEHTVAAEENGTGGPMKQLAAQVVAALEHGVNVDEAEVCSFCLLHSGYILLHCCRWTAA